ncbi:MAG: hypothetical protein LUD72_07900 [Bacteroidales bacterium]|nr:hypothetical protein [Bacteroidales bacterium]
MKENKICNVKELKERLLGRCYRQVSKDGSGYQRYVYIVNIGTYNPGGYDELAFSIVSFDHLGGIHNLDAYLPRMEYMTSYCHPRNFNQNNEWEGISFNCFMERFDDMNDNLKARLFHLHNKGSESVERYYN